MSDTSDCGCCTGTTIETPTGKSNPPGLSAISYRIGDWAQFKASMLSRLSSSDFPALAALTTRDDGDYTIALCDAAAMMDDVITFYQERIANEDFLRTATQRNSMIQLADLIGYQPSPGVAASVSLAFTLQTTPGQPAMAPQPSPVPVGTRAQSMPDPGQMPQTFETIGAITARVEWNAMPAQTSVAVPIRPGLTGLYLAGTATQLSQGDAILILGVERETDTTSGRWDIRWIESVTTDAANSLTYVTWTDGLSSMWGTPSTHGVKVYAFRQRAALFGNNAPDPRLMNIQNPSGILDSSGNWADFEIDTMGRAVDLDASYPKIVKGAWLALTGGADYVLGSGGIKFFPLFPPLNGYIALYKISGTAQTSRTGFGLSGKISRLQFDTDAELVRFGLRETQVLAQSDRLALANRPLTYPIYGSSLVLGSVQSNLTPGQLIAISGKCQRVVIGSDVTGITFPDNPSRNAVAGDSFILLAAPEQQVGAALQALTPEQLDPLNLPTGTLVWTLRDRDGETVTAHASAASLSLQSALSNDPTVSEANAIVGGADGITLDLDTTTVKLISPLNNCYDRATVAVNANVAPATAGQTVGEVGGSGDASEAGQSFTLKQSPLTYVLDGSDPTGRSPTLKAQINGITWKAVLTLYTAGPLDCVYALNQNNDGTTTVQFGDGIKGARLPTGQNNLRFSYRQGLGVAGNLRAGQVSMLLTRPAGVTGVSNPAPSSGGQDPETIDDARGNAPLHVLTLDRAVSTQDYADFARTFAGIAKAYSLWIGSGPARGVYVTIAGPDGETFEPTDAIVKGLAASLRQFGDALLPIHVQSFRNPTFTLSATVKVADDADPTIVLPAVESALRDAYSFDGTDFGTPVTLDGVYATMQNVAGVVAVDISQLFRLDKGPQPSEPEPRLIAALPMIQADGTVSPAELLTLDARPLLLGAMT